MHKHLNRHKVWWYLAAVNQFASGPAPPLFHRNSRLAGARRGR